MPRGFLVKRHINNYITTTGHHHHNHQPVWSESNKSLTLLTEASHHEASWGSLSPESEPEVLDLRVPTKFVYTSHSSPVACVPKRRISTNSSKKKAKQRNNSSGSSSSSKSVSHINGTSSSNNNNHRSSSSSSTNSIENLIRKKEKRNVNRKIISADQHKSSPVSGTFILDSDDETLDRTSIHTTGDIDPSLNLVVESDEARAELAKIENKIGDYVCCLCRSKYVSAFALAAHRCPRIVHIEYRCTQCEKVFNCPANLASHRRWHKPRDSVSGKPTAAPFNENFE